MLTLKNTVRNSTFCMFTASPLTRFSQLYPLIWESQNVRGWKGPLWVTQSNPLPKQGHLQQAAQELVQADLEYLQRRRLHNLPGQPVPGLHHPQSEEALPHVQTELPKFQFVPVDPCPVSGHQWKESGPVLLTPTLQISISISKVPQATFLLLL